MIVRYEDTDAERYRLEKIVDNRIDCLFCPGIMREGDRIIGIYGTGGYMKVEKIFFDSDVVLSDFSIMLFRAIEKMRDQLFFPDKMVLCGNNIFIKDDYSSLRIVYIREKRKISETRQIINLFYSLKKNCSADCVEKINEIIKRYSTGNNDIYKLTAYLNEMKRRQLYCGGNRTGV